MADRVLTPLLARLRFTAANLPRLPLIALLLVATAAGTRLVVLPDRQAAIDDAEQRLSRQERSARRAAIAQQSAPNASDSPADTRRRLLERFPTPNELNAELARLLDLAARHDLHLPSGDYRLQVAKDGLFDRYVLNLPVKGNYRQIRAYVAAVRREFPDLAVDDVSLRRDTIGSAELDAQLRFILFSRRGAA